MELSRRKYYVQIRIIVLLFIFKCGHSIIQQSRRENAEIRIATGGHWKAADNEPNTGYPDTPAPWRGSGVETGDVFRAVWNLPNSCGDKFGIDMPLSDYGIEFNSNHNWTHGDVLTLFNKHLGLYPHYENITGKMVAFNGGIPQLGNISQHLEKATTDIMAAIPNPDFTGVGVIDWEAWRPQWEQNFDALAIYRAKSRDLVQAGHPTWDKATIEVVAELEWTQAAKLYMESTLMLAKKLRPKAIWGYYSYPYCFNHKDGANMSCTENAVETNNDIMWLFNKSSALYPSIYLRPTHPNERAYVKGRLEEAFRLRDKSSNPHGVVLSYTRFNYSHSGIYFNLEDLNNTILQSAEMGAHGVVFWGDMLDDLSVASCTEQRNYMNSALGPVLMMTRKGAAACSTRVCAGHGRCVGSILTCGKSRQAGGLVGREGGGAQKKDDVCTCRCFEGWKGIDCSEPSVQ